MKRNHSYRAVAEFEEQESVLISWPSNTFSVNGENVEAVTMSIIKALQNRVRVIVQCFYTPIDEVKHILRNHGIDMKNIRFARYESDDITGIDDDLYVETTYPRDYGAEIIMNDEGHRRVVDFDNAYYCTAGANSYSREARAIKAFGRWHARLEGIDDILFTRLVSEGGDREFNGKGVMMCIEETEVAKRNPGLTRNEVEAEFKGIFNVQEIIWIPQSTFEDEDHFSGPIPGPTGAWNAYRSSSANGHVDEMARFVNEDTILLAEVSEAEAKEHEIDRINKDRLDKALEAIKNAKTTDGKPFTVVRIPTPYPKYYTIHEDEVLHKIWMETRGELEDTLLDGSPYPEGAMTVLPAQSYCNFLITNGAVLMQTYYREGDPPVCKEKDQKAKEIIQNIFPDRDIIAIDAMALNLLGGGIHCSTRHIPAARKRKE